IGDATMPLTCRHLSVFWIGVFILIGPALAGGSDVKPLLARIKAVGGKGEGNVDAGRAWQELSQKGTDALLEILAGLDDANPTAANWLRSAVEAIADRAVAAKKELPAAQLEKFVLDTRHSGPARRLAYDCLARVDG